MVSHQLQLTELYLEPDLSLKPVALQMHGTIGITFASFVSSITSVICM